MPTPRPAAPAHSPEAHQAITDELVRLTLGHRTPLRTELLVGLAALTAQAPALLRALTVATFRLTEWQARVLADALATRERKHDA